MGGKGKIENLKPWKPGQSGNPKGSSKAQRITNRLMEILEDRGLAETVALTLIGAALGDKNLLRATFEDEDGTEQKYFRAPNPAFMAQLMDRIEGKVAEKLIHKADSDLKSIRDYLRNTDDTKEGDDK